MIYVIFIFYIILFIAIGVCVMCGVCVKWGSNPGVHSTTELYPDLMLTEVLDYYVAWVYLAFRT